MFNGFCFIFLFEFIFFLFKIIGASAAIIPEELPSLLSVAYSNIPPIKKGNLIINILISCRIAQFDFLLAIISLICTRFIKIQIANEY